MLQARKIEKISLIYENCDGHTLTSDMFTGLAIEGVTKSYLINCYQYHEGEVSEISRCNFFQILVNKKGQKAQGFHDYVGTLKNRVTRHQDITCIQLYFIDGSEEEIYVPFIEHKKDIYVNAEQKVEQRGNSLVITIGKESNE